MSVFPSIISQEKKPVHVSLPPCSILVLVCAGAVRASCPVPSLLVVSRRGGHDGGPRRKKMWNFRTRASVCTRKRRFHVVLRFHVVFGLCQCSLPPALALGWPSPSPPTQAICLHPPEFGLASRHEPESDRLPWQPQQSQHDLSPVNMQDDLEGKGLHLLPSGI